MIIATAQSIPKDGNIVANIEDHYRLASIAADHGARLVVFPEMSLTGYAREMALGLSFVKDDARLNKLLQLAVERKITLIVGAPIQINNCLHIGSFILLPDNSVSIYTKQFLHPGEEQSFTPNFGYNPIIMLDDQRIAFAICSDIANPAHPANAAQKSTNLYIASIYYTPNGIGEGHEQLSNYAKTYSMNVLMANYGGPSYKYEAGGKCAFWTNNGAMIGQLKEEGESLLIIERKDNTWSSKMIDTKN